MSTLYQLHKNIRMYRLSKAMSQKEFGEAVGKSESQIGAYETGKSEIPVSVLFKIAEVCGIDAEDLFAENAQAVQKQEYDFEFRIFKVEDRRVIAGILVENGYDVGFHKKKRTRTGKSYDYYLHGRENYGSGDTDSRNEQDD